MATSKSSTNSGCGSLRRGPIAVEFQRRERRADFVGHARRQTAQRGERSLCAAASNVCRSLASLLRSSSSVKRSAAEAAARGPTVRGPSRENCSPARRARRFGWRAWKRPRRRSRPARLGRPPGSGPKSARSSTTPRPTTANRGQRRGQHGRGDLPHQAPRAGHRLVPILLDDHVPAGAADGRDAPSTGTRDSRCTRVGRSRAEQLREAARLGDALAQGPMRLAWARNMPWRRPGSIRPSRPARPATRP